MEDYGFERYSKFRPTQFDGHIEMDDREDWLVMPVSQTRDSGIRTKSNFAEFLKGLGGESDTVEVHRFGHWGPGWFEIIIVDPEATDVLSEAYDMARSLQDYPVLNDEACSAAEWESVNEDWENYGASDFRKELLKTIESEMFARWDEPFWDEQDFCQHWNMPVMVCGCGDCLATYKDIWIDLEPKIDDMETEELRQFAKDHCDMEEEFCEGSSPFRWKMLDVTKLILTVIDWEYENAAETVPAES